MFLTVHAATGILIGQYSSNIGLAFIAGFFSHFLLDIIPHGDSTIIDDNDVNVVKKIAKLALGDGLIMISLYSILFYQGLITLSWLILAGMVGAIAPDFIRAFYLLFKPNWLIKYSKFHTNLHFIFKNFEVSFFNGIIIQFVVLVSSIMAAIYLK